MQVTEKDIRIPEFRDADVKDLEFRSDGKIVRKDRWETGFHKVVAILGLNNRDFEIQDVVDHLDSLFPKCAQGFRGCSNGKACTSDHK